MHYLPALRRVAAVSLITLLAGCGGGGSEDGAATQVDLSTHAIDFGAITPLDPAPASQVVTATVGQDIAHLAVVHSGAAISSATSELDGRSARITIVPKSPTEVGPGVFNAAVAVTGYTCGDAACTRMSAGSTQIVNVTYQVSPLVQQVAPRIVPSGTAGVLAIRGLGLQRYALQGVRLGDVAATEYTLVGDTELRVSYPALAAGSYTIQLDASGHEGQIPSTATLVVQDPTALAAGTLAHPATVSAVRTLFYDADRQALVVGSDASGGSVTRYGHAGGVWTAPEVQAVSQLRDIAVSTDGSQLVVVTNTTLNTLNADTLAPGTALTAPSLPDNAFLKNVVLDILDRAVITTGIGASSATPAYGYELGGSALFINSISLNNATPGLSADRSRAVMIQGDPSLTADPLMYSYNASTTQFLTTGITANQNAVAPVLTSNAGRVIVRGQRVYDENFSLLGTLPDTTAALAVNPAGTRAYTYDTAAGGILVFDISADVDEAAYAPLGAVTALAGDPGAAVKMAISPDGATLFLAGSTQIVIQPTP